MFLVITMAIVLSLDALSIALVLGITEGNIKNHFFYAFLVGILHFIMPSLGAITNNILFNNIVINSNKLLGIILLILFISMLIDLKKDDLNISKSNIIILALSVSIDSYFAGLGLKSQDFFKISYFLLFSLFSFSFSMLGCKLGSMGKEKMGKYSNYIALFILLILSVKYILFN